MFLAEVAKKNFPKWNGEVLTEEDARAFCRKNKICITETTRVNFGKYTRYKDFDFILLNPNLQMGMRFWVLWHEISHFLLHAPASSNFSPSTKRKNDREANYLAAVALIPKTLVETKSFGELQDDFGYPLELIEIRKYIYDNEQI